jgi:hypothetical protein
VVVWCGSSNAGLLGDIELLMSVFHLGQLADEGDAALALGIQLGLDALLPVRLIRKWLAQRLREPFIPT